MIRWGNWKYVYFVGYPPQLFDLDADPEEINDLAAPALRSGAQTSKLRNVLAECEKRLRSVCDPEEVDRRAKRFQARLREELGLAGLVHDGDHDEDGESKAALPVPHPEVSYP